MCSPFGRTSGKNEKYYITQKTMLCVGPIIDQNGVYFRLLAADTICLSTSVPKGLEFSEHRDSRVSFQACGGIRKGPERKNFPRKPARTCVVWSSGGPQPLSLVLQPAAPKGNGSCRFVIPRKIPRSRVQPVSMVTRLRPDALWELQPRPARRLISPTPPKTV